MCANPYVYVYNNELDERSYGEEASEKTLVCILQEIASTDRRCCYSQ